jgi:phosphodiesterase/alkaline phosphatase D-like protein
MKRFILTFAVIVAIAGLIQWFADDLVIAAVPTHKAAQLTAGPELETATDGLAIIRWTTTNPGGTDLHYGIVHYGTDSKNLNQVAKSPNRRNPSHPDMNFRVRIMGLNSNTTYYYRVESAGATDVSDGALSPVKTFKTDSAAVKSVKGA